MKTLAFTALLGVYFLISCGAYAGDTCTFDYDNANKSIAADVGIENGLAHQIQVKQKEIDGPLSSAQDKTQADLKNADFNVTANSHYQAMLDQLIPLLQRLDVVQAANQSFKDLFAEQVAAQPDIAVSSTFEILLSQLIGRLTVDEVSDFKVLIDLLKVFEGSQKAWLTQAKALQDSMAATAQSPLASLLQNALQLKAEAGASGLLLKTEQANDGTALTDAQNDLQKAHADLIDLQNELKTVQNRLTKVRAAYPAIKKAMQACEDREALRHLKDPT